MSIQAMKQWLEALELMYACYAHPEWISHKQQEEKILAQCVATTMTLRQAIAEAEKQEPKCVVIVEVFGKEWRLEYMSLPVGRHKLYAQQYIYTHPQPKHEPLLVFAKECVLGAYRESELADAAQRAINAAERNK